LKRTQHSNKKVYTNDTSTTEAYEETLNEALADLKTLQTKRAEIETKIESTKQMIVSIRAILGDISENGERQAS
jgi:hypothetical protein